MVLTELGTWAVSTIAGGIAGNQAYDKLKSMRQQARRTFAGTFGAPADHDIDKAVASAAYQAVMVVLKDYEAAAGHGLAQDFAQTLSVALRERVPLFRDPWTDHEIPTAARPHLNRLIAASGGTPEAVADIGPFLTDVMLAEVTEIAGGIPVPEAFVATMTADEPNGFFPRFRAFISREISINDHFNRLFVATRLAEVVGGVDLLKGEMERFAREAVALRDVVKGLEKSFDSMRMENQDGHHETQRLLRELMSRAPTISTKEGVSETLVRKFLSDIFKIDTPEEQVEPLLERLIQEWKSQSELLARLSGISNQDAEAGKVLAQAKAAYDAEDIEAYKSLAKEVAERLEAADREDEAVIAQVEARRAARRENLIVARKLSIEAAKASLDPKATADALWALFEVETPSTMPQPERFQAARALQEEWYVRGRDKGLNVDLAVSIELSHLTMGLALGPDQRGELGNDLGTALSTLGERESGTARLEEAVTAYRAALEEWTRERVPLDWAGTQNNLGNALRTLGERESGTARLEEAVLAYSAALEEWTRGRVPLQWAMAQNNLGNALSRLGERESGTARLEEAVAAYRAALEEWTRERVPLDWAATQNNLGNALSRLGERESGTARLEEAVLAYSAALEEWTRERVPLDWAATQNNHGSALSMLGEGESGTARLEEAVAAYRAALEEYTRERAPLGWAASTGNLGSTMAVLAKRSNSSSMAKEAITLIRGALQVAADADHVPFQNVFTHALRQAEAVVESLK